MNVINCFLGIADRKMQECADLINIVSIVLASLYFLLFGIVYVNWRESAMC